MAGALFVPGQGVPHSVSPDFMAGIDLFHFADHPLQVILKVFVMKLSVKEHFDDVVIGPRRLHVFPAPVAPLETCVQFIQSVALAQPSFVASQGVFAVTGIAAAHGRPGRGHLDGVPQPPR